MSIVINDAMNDRDILALTAAIQAAEKKHLKPFPLLDSAKAMLIQLQKEEEVFAAIQCAITPVK